MAVFDHGGARRSTADFTKVSSQYETLVDGLADHGRAGASFQDVVTKQEPDWMTDRLKQFFLSTYLTFDTGDLDQLAVEVQYPAGVVRDHAGVQAWYARG